MTNEKAIEKLRNAVDRYDKQGSTTSEDIDLMRSVCKALIDTYKGGEKWEYFCDAAYYDLWAVRKVGETRWGFCFHLNSKEEAEGLTELLNTRTTALDKLMEKLK